MRPRLDDIAPAATVAAALAELQLTEAEFWALDADRFAEVVAQHGQRVKAWQLREQARIDQAEAGRRSIDGTPADMSVWRAGAEGFIDASDARGALQSLAALMDAERTDPAPNSEAVSVLLTALAESFGGGGAV